MNTASLSELLLVVAFVLTARALAQRVARDRADEELAELRKDIDTALAGDLTEQRRAELVALVPLVEEEQEELTSCTMLQSIAVFLWKGLSLRDLATAAKHSKGAESAEMCPEHTRLRVIAGRYFISTLPIIRASFTVMQGILTMLFFGAFAGAVLLDFCARVGDVAMGWVGNGTSRPRTRSHA